MSGDSRIELFETAPVPKAVLKLCIPTVLSSLVMVLYNLADTFFVGMLNDPVQNAAVTLAAPVLLAFNAINNLFGVGTSSMMSRALGVKAYETVYRSSAFGFYCTFHLSVFVLDSFARRCSVDTECCSCISCSRRGLGYSCKYRDYERMLAEYNT